MDKRKALRPILEKIEFFEKYTETEQFQNTTLRQIIKLQHTLLIAILKEYLTKRKVDFTSLTEQKARKFIESALSKDIAFKNLILGCIVGHFTMDEFTDYQKASSEFNRRIITIIKKRLKDSYLELV